MANNFIQFNSNKNNMMDDTTYAQQAPLGIVGGGGTKADSKLHNKLFYQTSSFVKAFSDVIEYLGRDMSDSDISQLAQSILYSQQNASINYYRWDKIVFSIPFSIFSNLLEDPSSDPTVPQTGIKQLLFQYQVDSLTQEEKDAQSKLFTFPYAFSSLFYVFISTDLSSFGEFDTRLYWNILNQRINNTSINIDTGILTENFWNNITVDDGSGAGATHLSYLAIGIV